MRNDACFDKVNDFANGQYRDDCMRQTKFNCYFDHHNLNTPPEILKNMVYNQCFLDFRTDPVTGEKKYESASEGYSITEGSRSEISFTRRWNVDMIDGGALTGSTPQPCSFHNIDNVYASTRIRPEISYWDTTSLSESINDLSSEATIRDNTNIFVYKKPLTLTKAYYFPKIRRDMEVGFTITICYCPSFESPLDSDQTPCNSGFEFTQEIGAMRFWHYLLCDL